MDIAIRHDCDQVDWNLIHSTLERVGMGTRGAEILRQALIL